MTSSLTNMFFLNFLNFNIFFFAGCAFLTYVSRESAVKAQNALHEKITLPGVRQRYKIIYVIYVC